MIIAPSIAAPHPACAYAIVHKAKNILIGLERLKTNSILMVSSAKAGADSCYNCQRLLEGIFGN